MNLRVENDPSSHPVWRDAKAALMCTERLIRLARFRQPLLMTRGDQSPPFFYAILDKIAAAVPDVQEYAFQGAGHVPHVTHPDDFVRVVSEFVQLGKVHAV